MTIAAKVESEQITGYVKLYPITGTGEVGQMSVHQIQVYTEISDSI